MEVIMKQPSSITATKISLSAMTRLVRLPTPKTPLQTIFPRPSPSMRITCSDWMEIHLPYTEETITSPKRGKSHKGFLLRYKMMEDGPKNQAAEIATA